MTNREAFDLALKCATEFAIETCEDCLYEMGIHKITHVKIDTFPLPIHVGIEDVDTDSSFKEWGKKEARMISRIQFESPLYTYLVDINNDKIHIYKTGILASKEIEYN